MTVRTWIPVPTRLVSVLLAVTVLATVVAPGFAPKKSEAFLGTLLTVGAVWLLGSSAKDGIEDLIGDAEGAAKAVIQEAAQQIGQLLDELESTYANALDTTLDSLDSFTGQTLARLASLFEQINQQLMQDVGVIKDALLDLLREVNTTIQQVLSRLEDLIVVATRGATFVIDKTTYNLAFLIAVVLLAVGLLIFVRLFWSGKVPGGWMRWVSIGLMAFYLLLFSALLVPQARVYAITMVGQGEQLEAIGSGPQVFSVMPSRVYKGSVVNFQLIGVHFDSGGQPKVVIGGQEVAPQAYSDSSIAVRLTGSLAQLSGQQTVAVKTADGQQTTAMIEFAAPPQPPALTSWRLVPSGMMADFRLSNSLVIACDGTSAFPPVDATTRELKAATGWELAQDSGHGADLASELHGSLPNPPRGFTEQVLELKNGAQVIRNVSYLPATGSRKDGIKVTLTCVTPGKARVSYRIWEQNWVRKDGSPETGSNCVAQGTKQCGAYPDAKLSGFKNGLPEAYSLRVTVRTSAGDSVDATRTFTPGVAGQSLVIDNVTVWMENNQLWVKGPSPEPIVVRPIKPLPPLKLKPLPIYTP